MENPSLFLTAKNIACIKGSLVLFRKLSFDLGAGQLLWLRGPNGIGKSSLIRILANLAKPSYGTLMLRDPAYFLLHYVSDQPALHGEMSVAENLGHWLKLMGGSTKNIEEAKEQFSLGDFWHVKARYLSFGQRKRASLARLLLKFRPLWLLDEPLVGLDTNAQEAVLALMQKHRNRGGSILITSHQAFTSDVIDNLDLRQYAARRFL